MFVSNLHIVSVTKTLQIQWCSLLIRVLYRHKQFQLLAKLDYSAHKDLTEILYSFVIHLYVTMIRRQDRLLTNDIDGSGICSTYAPCINDKLNCNNTQGDFSLHDVTFEMLLRSLDYISCRRFFFYNEIYVEKGQRLHKYMQQYLLMWYVSLKCRDRRSFNIVKLYNMPVFREMWFIDCLYTADMASRFECEFVTQRMPVYSHAVPSSRQPPPWLSKFYFFYRGLPTLSNPISCNKR